MPNVGETLGVSQVVTLTPGQYDDTLDAGLYRKGSIHPFGFLDKDGDGVQDGDEVAFPLDPGKTFVLTGDIDGDGDIDTLTGTTDANGEVHFEGLTPGTYTLKEDPIPTGYYLSSATNERSFTITSGEELVYQDGVANVGGSDERYETNLGSQLKWGNAELACLGNFVWHDLNANGQQDANEPGIDNVTVNLLKDTDNDGTPDTVVATKVTGDDPSTGAVEQGFYKFSGLMPGVSYQVEFVNPDSDGCGPRTTSARPIRATTAWTRMPCRSGPDVGGQQVVS